MYSGSSRRDKDKDRNDREEGRESRDDRWSKKDDRKGDRDSGRRAGAVTPTHTWTPSASTPIDSINPASAGRRRAPDSQLVAYRPQRDYDDRDGVPRRTLPTMDPETSQNQRPPSSNDQRPSYGNFRGSQSGGGTRSKQQEALLERERTMNSLATATREAYDAHWSHFKEDPDYLTARSINSSDSNAKECLESYTKFINKSLVVLFHCMKVNWDDKHPTGTQRDWEESRALEIQMLVNEAELSLKDDWASAIPPIQRLRVTDARDDRQYRSEIGPTRGRIRDENRSSRPRTYQDSSSDSGETVNPRYDQSGRGPSRNAPPQGSYSPPQSEATAQEGRRGYRQIYDREVVGSRSKRDDRLESSRRAETDRRSESGNTQASTSQYSIDRDSGGRSSVRRSNLEWDGRDSYGRDYREDDR